MPKRLDIEYVRNYIEGKGYKLVDNVYISAHSKLHLICSKGHDAYIRWNDFQQGVRCEQCFKRGGRNKLSYSDVNEYIESQGYTLITKEYESNTQWIGIKCPKGHIFITNFCRFKNGNRCPVCYKKYNMLECLKRGRDTILKNVKGYSKRRIPTYDLYAHRIGWCEDVRRCPEDPNIMEVRCIYCGKWHIPKISSVNNRIRSIKGLNRGEHHFYCSEGCKKACSIYGKDPITIMREDALRAGRLSWLELNREVQPELRQMVLKRDKYKCVKCGSIGPLHCHHILPAALEPLESADVDNCVTLCEKCHKEVHSQPGCRYSELKMEVC